MKYNKRLADLDGYKPSSRYSEDVTNKLDWNEASIFPSKKALQEIKKYISEYNIFEYPDISANDLKQSLENYLKINKNNIEVFNGSDEALNTIFECLLDEDKKILYFSPTYNQIKTLIGIKTNNVHCRHIVNPLKEHAYDFSSLELFDVVYIVNPNNPTGICLSVNKIEELLNLFPNTFFIVDEAYTEFSGTSAKDLVLKYKNILITRTFSKAFALASLRVGYVLSHTDNLEKINKIRNGKSVNAVGQYAAISCLKHITDFNKHVKKTIVLRKSFISFINKTKNFSCQKSSSNFVLINTKYNHILINKLKENGFLVRDFSNIKNLENCVRITIGTKQQMELIKKVIKEIDND